ncbi:hypothetical protein B0H14DRAFT_2608223 [Mycena olivaceomarginata]|nr:hypothetical protein B0H14DRAFT_2608223 [Mycena olivaceomarginata]
MSGINITDGDDVPEAEQDQEEDDIDDDTGVALPVVVDRVLRVRVRDSSGRWVAKTGVEMDGEARISAGNAEEDIGLIILAASCEQKAAYQLMSRRRKRRIKAVGIITKIAAMTLVTSRVTGEAEKEQPRHQWMCCWWEFSLRLLLTPGCAACGSSQLIWGETRVREKARDKTTRRWKDSSFIGQTADGTCPQQLKWKRDEVKGLDLDALRHGSKATTDGPPQLKSYPGSLSSWGTQFRS